MKRWVKLIIFLWLVFGIIVFFWKFPIRDFFNMENLDVSNTQTTNSGESLEIQKMDTQEVDQKEPIKSDSDFEKEIHNAPTEDKEIENILDNQENITNNNFKKIGYINKMYIDSQKNAKIIFDEIIILPNEQCEGLEICFKNDDKRTTIFSVSDGIEIESYFTNYLVNGEIKKSKTIYLPCFLELFTEDNAEDYKRFNKIPYRITIDNGQVTKIEEQNVVGLYQ